MRFTKAIIISSLLFITITGFAQSEYKNVVEIGFSFGLSNTIGSFDTYSVLNSSIGPIFMPISIKEKYSSRVPNFNVSYTRYIDNKNGIKISLGRVDYGLKFRRETASTNGILIENHTVKFVEFGLSYARKIQVSSYAKIIIEPGLLFHINPEYGTRNFQVLHRNAFSFASFTGIEFPIVENNFTINSGLLLKLPIMKYDYPRDPELGYYPYFIGIKLGMNYQF